MSKSVKTELCLFAVLATAIGCGTVSQYNHVELQKGAIFSSGRPCHGTDMLDVIEIDLSSLPQEIKTNAWIEFRDSSRIRLSEISEEKVEPHSNRILQNPEVKSKKSYYAGGYCFAFDTKEPISVLIAKNGFPSGNKVAFTQFGTFTSGSSLSLPCSVNDFEKVFGKADWIRRWRAL